uniref:Uncharacterized protein n=1 Tax=Mesocestoides corti TaxID=53468 RepID=A0A5K3FV79_MESCO
MKLDSPVMRQSSWFFIGWLPLAFSLDDIFEAAQICHFHGLYSDDYFSI